MTSPYAAFRHGLARGLHPWSSRERLTAVWWGYFDESGTHGDPDVFMLAGYVGPERAWISLEADWIAELTKRPCPLDWYHRVDAEHGKGEFQKTPEHKHYWDRTRRDALTKTLAGIVSRYRLFGFCVALKVREFKAHFVPNLKGKHERVFKDPYLFCFHTAMDWMFETLPPRLPKREKVSFVFSENEPVLGSVARRYCKIIRRSRRGDVFHMIGFAPMHQCVPLQVADLLAYESYHWTVARKESPVMNILLRGERVKWDLATKGRFIRILAKWRASDSRAGSVS